MADYVAHYKSPGGESPVSGVGLLAVQPAAAASLFIVRVIAHLGRKLASLFVRTDELVQRRGWTAMAPAWRTVRFVAFALVAGGAALALVGWLLVGCDGEALVQGLRAISSSSGGVVSLGM